jgi:hypothetical protein
MGTSWHMGTQGLQQKPGTYMAYKKRQYSEKDGHQFMKAIIAQKKSYNDEQEGKRQKKSKEMNAKNCQGE